VRREDTNGDRKKVDFAKIKSAVGRGNRPADDVEQRGGEGTKRPAAAPIELDVRRQRTGDRAGDEEVKNLNLFIPKGGTRRRTGERPRKTGEHGHQRPEVEKKLGGKKKKKSLRKNKTRGRVSPKAVTLPESSAYGRVRDLCAVKKGRKKKFGRIRDGANSEKGNKGDKAQNIPAVS